MTKIDAKRFYIEATVLACLGVPLVGLLDYWTGYGLQVSILYLIPVFGAAWYCGFWPGLAVSALTGVMSLVVDNWLGHVTATVRVVDPSVPVSLWNACMRLWLFFPVAYLAANLRTHLDQERRFARLDPLTGILNGRAFSAEAERFIALSKRKMQPVTVVYIDLDDFKRVNDTQGHSGGDKILCAVATTLLKCTRPYDLVARLGGDEFCVLLPETGSDEAKSFMAKASEKLEQEANRSNWQVSFSVGVATFPVPPASVDVALGAADELMYQAKRSGKRQVVHKEWPMPDNWEAEVRGKKSGW